MRRVLALLGVAVLINITTFAADTLNVTLNATHFKVGDTLVFEASSPRWVAENRNGTLNVYLQHNGALQRMRYPILRGKAEGSILIDSMSSEGLFAAVFSIQDDFFEFLGTIKSPYKDRQMKMVVMLDDTQIADGLINVADDKTFSSGKLLFAGRAKFYFSPAKANRNNDIDIIPTITLDSSFMVIADKTMFFSVGAEKIDAPKDVVLSAAMLAADDTATLQNVEVLGKKKTPVEAYAEERVTGMFKNSDAKVFDGIGSNQFIGFRNILEWLSGRVAGLRIQPVSITNYRATWQGGETLFYLDEMQVDGQTLATIPTADIAMIKVFNPPFYGGYLGGAGGAIAVYTKNGSSGSQGPRNNFSANGYTPINMQLPFKNAGHNK